MTIKTSERNQRILALSRKGASFRDIGQKYNISGARAFYLVKREQQREKRRQRLGSLHDKFSVLNLLASLGVSLPPDPKEVSLIPRRTMKAQPDGTDKTIGAIGDWLNEHGYAINEDGPETILSPAMIQAGVYVLTEKGALTGAVKSEEIAKAVFLAMYGRMPVQLAKRTASCLRKGGLTNITRQDVVKRFTQEELLQLPGFGTHSLRNLKEWLAEEDLELRSS